MRARLILIIVLIAGSYACASSEGARRPVAAQPRALPPAEFASARSPILKTALGMVGVPYRSGGTDPSGFDCSGLVQYVFAHHGISVPREVRDQARLGTKIPADAIAAGDLLFFSTVSSGPSHVAIAIGNGLFVHAPSSRGVVRVERLDSSYWRARYVGARRVAS